MKTTEYRAYFFGNMYLSQIQQGIQAAHVVAEMSVAYKKETGLSSKAYDVYWEWALNHKTMILLNGGYQSSIQEVYSNISNYSTMLQLPFSKFNEEQESLNGALTSIGVIIPSFIYDYKNVSNYSSDSDEHKKHFDYHLMQYTDVKKAVNIYGDGFLDVCYNLHNLIKQFRLA